MQGISANIFITESASSIEQGFSAVPQKYFTTDSIIGC